MLPSSQLSSSSKRKSSLACFAILLLLAGFDRSARAAVKVWSGGGLLNGNWSTGANWGGSPPNAGDDLIFPNVVVGLRNTNDFVGRGFSSIILTGSNYVVQGNSLFLTNGLSAQHLNFTNTFNRRSATDQRRTRLSVA